MMNKQQLTGMYGYFKMVHGVTRRMIDQVPADKIDFKPTPEQRSFGETVVHMYSFLDSSMSTAKAGKFTSDEEVKAASKQEMLDLVDKKFAHAMSTLETITDEELPKVVEAYGQSFPAWQFPAFAYDEHWHHRGALTVYLRLLGIEPLMIYDY
jgi:uncharacterized damage-inducible protein DinB